MQFGFQDRGGESCQFSEVQDSVTPVAHLLVTASPGLGEEGKLYLLIGRIHTRRERFAGGYL